MSEYDEQADKFLKDNNLIMEIKEDMQSPPPWYKEDKRDYGIKYRVTIKDGSRSVTFPFWNSVYARDRKEKLKPYSVLACISGDVYCPETFEDFCSEYDYDTDSRRAERTFHESDVFARKLRAFFTEDEISQLVEIQ